MHVAALVSLGQDEVPANDTFSVIVDLNSLRGASGITDVVLHRYGAIFYVAEPHGQAQKASAVEQAREWANNMGLSKVYLTHRVQTFRGP